MVERHTERGFILLLLTTLVLLSFGISLNRVSGLQQRGPIVINSNTDFTSANGVTSGSGTALDPYLIDSWEISPAPFYDKGIVVSNTNAYFVMQNVNVHQLNVELRNVTNASVNGLVAPRTNFYGIVDAAIRNISSPFVVVGTCNTPAGCAGYDLVSRRVRISDSHITQVVVNEASNVTLMNNIVSSSDSDGIAVNYAYNISIVGNNVNSNKRDGMSITSNVGTSVSDNSIVSNVEHGILIEGGTNVTIHNNFFSGNGLGLADRVKVQAAGLTVRSAGPVNVSGNTFSSDGILVDPTTLRLNISNNLVNGRPLIYYSNCAGVNLDGIQVGQLVASNCTGMTLKNLQIRNTNNGIELSSVRDVLVSQSELSFNNADGILIYASSNVTVSNTKVIGNKSDGIAVSSTNKSSGHAIVYGNEVGSNGDGVHFEFGAGINLNADNSTVSHNKVYSNTLRGIFVSGTNITVSQNNATSNGTPSQLLTGGIIANQAQFLWISGNKISGNNEYGLGMFNSKYVNVTGNTLMLNRGYGIALVDAWPGTIYHDNLFNDEIEAGDCCVGPYEPTWFLPYPGGGNYWSDYIGTDSCSGANQKVCTGPDGIGDTPYFIARHYPGYCNGACPTGNTTDQYPLMAPYGIPRESEPPLWPVGSQLKVTDVSSSDVTLNWPLATDSVAVVRYAIFMGDKQLTTVKGTVFTYTVAGLTPGISYTFRIEAANPWGYWSSNGPSASATTQGGSWWLQYWYLIVATASGAFVSLLLLRRFFITRKQPTRFPTE